MQAPLQQAVSEVRRLHKLNIELNVEFDIDSLLN